MEGDTGHVRISESSQLIQKGPHRLIEPDILKLLLWTRLMAPVASHISISIEPMPNNPSKGSALLEMFVIVLKGTRSQATVKTPLFKWTFDMISLRCVHGVNARWERVKDHRE